MSYRIQPHSQLQGNLLIPPSKSQTLRALTFALLAKGKSRIRQYLHSPDTDAMIHAIQNFGAIVHSQEHEMTVDGIDGQIETVENVIDCGNSGQILRFLGALSTLSPRYTVFTGDHSIRHRRLSRPLLDALTELGAFATSCRGDGFAPIVIKGPLTQDKVTVDGSDSQPISGLLIAGSFAPHPIEIHVKDPGETPWVNLTLEWLKRFSIPFTNENFRFFQLQGGAQIEGFDYQVPGDFSSATYGIAAALLTHSELTLHGIDLNDPQPDRKLLSIFEQMGAHFTIDPLAKTLKIKKCNQLTGMRIDCNDCIDTLPLLAVIGCFAKGETAIVNASIARHKECDRIHSIATELKKMGADITEREDGLLIRQSPLKGAHLHTYNDHRLVLALTIAALAASQESIIDDTISVKKSYPQFFTDLIAIGAKIEKI